MDSDVTRMSSIINMKRMIRDNSDLESGAKFSKEKRGGGRGGVQEELLSLAYVAAIQSPHEQSPSYKYSDPAVVLMSKVYQTTDSIHVEKATLPGNSPTNRDRAGVCLSIIMGWRERERQRQRKTAYHHSVYRPHWAKSSAHSQDQNHRLFKKEKNTDSQLRNKQTNKK